MAQAAGEFARWFRVAIAASFVPITAGGQGIMEIMAISGTAPPEGNGNFSWYPTPVWNNAGQTAFVAPSRENLRTAFFNGIVNTSNLNIWNDDKYVFKRDNQTQTETDPEPHSLAWLLTTLAASRGLRRRGNGE